MSTPPQAPTKKDNEKEEKKVSKTEPVAEAKSKSTTLTLFTDLKQISTSFSYANLCHQLNAACDRIRSGNYTAGRDICIGSDGEIHLTAFFILRHDNAPKIKTTKNTWKAHCTLNTTIKDNVAKGWDVFIPIAIRHGIGLFKVVIPGVELTDEQTGKEMTIIISCNPNFTPTQWNQFFREVTRSFVTYNVQPGYKCSGSPTKSEMEIKGSSFFSARFEGTLTAEILSAFPFAGVDLSDIRQPPQRQPEQHAPLASSASAATTASANASVSQALSSTINKHD